jgi:hypothetical protein
MAMSVVFAGDAAPDPSCYLPEHGLATLRLNDLPRSRARFAATPYAKLLETGWGKLLAKQLKAATDRSAKEGLDVAAALAGLTQVVAGIAMDADRMAPDIGVAAVVQGDTGAVQAWCAKLLSAEARVGAGAQTKAWLGGAGQITQLGQLFVFQSAPADGGAVEEAKPRVPAEAPAFPASCLESRLDLEGLLGLIARLTKSPPNAFAKPGSLSTASLSLSLDPIGLREHWHAPFPAAHAEEYRALSYPAADLGALRTLPGSTLFAAVARIEAATSAKQLAIAGLAAGDPSLAQIDAALADAGLPGYLELLGAIDGQVLAYCEEGVPFPTATVAIGMKPEVGGRLLKTLAEKLAMAANGDGSFGGFLGILALQAAYQDGQLVLTTNPGGVAGFKDRKSGFAELPEIKAALGEIKPGAIVAGVSRSGASWGAFAQLAWLPLSQLGLDARYASLPQDLRAVAKYGFLSYQRSADGFDLDSGGLAGGVAALYSLGVGSAAGYFFYQMGMLGQALGQPNAPVPAKPAAPVKPEGGEPVF